MRWVRAISVVGICAVLGACGLIQPRESAESVNAQGALIEGTKPPSESASPTLPGDQSTTTTSTPVLVDPDMSADPMGDPVAGPDGGELPLVDPALFMVLDPAQLPPLPEPELALPMSDNYPNAPDFCRSGVKVAQMGDQLLQLPPATEKERVMSQVREFFYQLGRTVALAPGQMSPSVDQVRWAVITEADLFNSIRTPGDYRQVLSEVVRSNPGLEPAVNQMVRFCGSDKNISLSVES